MRSPVTAARAQPARRGLEQRRGRPVARQAGRVGAAGAVAARGRCRTMGERRTGGGQGNRSDGRSGLGARAGQRRRWGQGRRVAGRGGRVGRQLLDRCGAADDPTLRTDRTRDAHRRSRRRDVGLRKQTARTRSAGDERRPSGGGGRRVRTGIDPARRRRPDGRDGRRVLPLDGRAGARHGGRAVRPA